MGQIASGLRRKDEKPSTEENVTVTQSATPARARSRPDQFIHKYAEIFREKGIIPEMFLVRESPSAQFVDEDGDVAHEFLAEKAVGKGKQRRLCRIIDNLTPKGKESYAIPRLSPDLPVVILELKEK